MLEAVMLVVAGAALGGGLRFLVTHLSSTLSHHHGFPYGTLAVNALGCFLVGFVLTWPADHEHDRWRLLVATGFCGGFTTFSAFAYESMAYLHEARWMSLAMNVMLNNVLSFAALIAGIRLHQTMR
jgi:CrcB protein